MGSTSPRTKRFHVSVGPASLFDRARQVIHEQEPIDLKLHPTHHLIRRGQRNPPPEIYGSFRSAQWELVTVEVLGNGKWFSSGWRRRIGEETWFLVLGGRNEIVTLYCSEVGMDVPVRDFKNNISIVQQGDPFFGFVNDVNQALLEHEG